MSVWHFVLWVTGVLPGYWAAFWQGFGSGPIAWCVLPLGYYIHHMCHTHNCFRLGHPVQGVVMCKKHLSKESRIG